MAVISQRRCSISAIDVSIIAGSCNSPGTAGARRVFSPRKRCDNSASCFARQKVGGGSIAVTLVFLNLILPTPQERQSRALIGECAEQKQLDNHSRIGQGAFSPGVRNHFCSTEMARGELFGVTRETGGVFYTFHARYDSEAVLGAHFSRKKRAVKKTAGRDSQILKTPQGNWLWAPRGAHPIARR